MLRRPPTTINLTTEDLSAYEQERTSRAARSQPQRREQQSVRDDDYPHERRIGLTATRNVASTITVAESNSRSLPEEDDATQDVEMGELGDQTQLRPNSRGEALSQSEDSTGEATPDTSREAAPAAPRAIRRNIRRPQQDNTADAATPTPANPTRRDPDDGQLLRRGPMAPSRYERITGVMEAPVPRGSDRASMR